MKLEDQVLSIKQVQELQELGFDIIKNSSAIVIIKENDTFIVDKEMIEKNIFGITDKIEDLFYSMTIGDIIEVLPILIYYLEEYETRLIIKKTYYGYTINYDNIFSSLRETVGIPFSTYKNNYIDALFDCLMWCIKQKHIKI
jgi:hypothetical protein